jgi:hypothetical protein
LGTNDAANITTGTIATARLASGTANSGTFLRGDQTWTAVSVTPTAVSDQNNTSTGYFDLPSGTTAQRPGSPTAGMVRFNTNYSIYEAYDGSAWKQVSLGAISISAEYLVVAGGGAGGTGDRGGAGGAGGYLTGTTSLSVGTTYTVTVGAGGAGSNNQSVPGANGSDSSISGIATSIGGGGGGSRNTKDGVSGG